MPNPTIFNFDSTNIRVVTGTNGEPWFVAADVCAALEFGNPWQAVKTHVAIDDLQSMEVIDTVGRTQQANHINESGLYSLIFGSTKESAKRFKKWVTSEVLPAIRKTGNYAVTTATNHTEATAALLFWDAAVKSLNIAPSGHLGGVRAIATTYGYEALLPHLPNYAIDAPTSSTTGSSEPTASASTLLKKHDIKMSTVKFNTKLVEIGLLADMTRPSTSSPTGFKTFKAVVGKGLDYGKNVTNPGNPRETQPHWYSHKFLDLIDLLK
jgi:prophage antirepressor-like protein